MADAQEEVRNAKRSSSSLEDATEDEPDAKRQRVEEGMTHFGELVTMSPDEPGLAEVDPNTEVEMKILVPGNDVGFFIGKSGKTIKDMQEASGANVRISKDNDIPLAPNCRSVSLTGPLAAVSRAQQAVAFLKSELAAKKGVLPDGNQQTLQIAIPSSVTGMLIGKKGETIKGISTKSGAHAMITRDSEMREGFSERLITCQGALDQIRVACILVAVEVSKAREMQSVPGFESVEIVWVPDRHVGLVIGKAGVTIKQLNADSGATMDMGKEQEAKMGERPVRIRGTRECIEAAKNALRNLLLPVVSQDSGMPQFQTQLFAQQQAGWGAMPAMAGAMPTPYGGGFQGQRSTEIISVPGEHAGLVIGKQGGFIKHLATMTGAEVQVAPEDGPGARRAVTITGTPGAIVAAKRLIEDKFALVLGDAPGGGANVSQPGQRGSENVAIVLNIPDEHAGLIIGKGGKTLKQLKMDSGAAVIYVKKPHEAVNGERPVDVKGAAYAVAMAQALIIAKVAEVGGEVTGGYDVATLPVVRGGAGLVANAFPAVVQQQPAFDPMVQGQQYMAAYGQQAAYVPADAYAYPAYKPY